jgi:hypothetical protein
MTDTMSPALPADEPDNRSTDSGVARDTAEGVPASHGAGANHGPDHHRREMDPFHRTRNRPSTSLRRHPQATALDHYYGNDSSHLQHATVNPDGPRNRARRGARCPHRPTGMVVNRHTGQVVPPQCRRLRCPYCIVPRAIGVGQAIAQAKPNLWVTLTDTGRDWPEVRHGMRMFKQQLRRDGVDGHFAYNLEASHGGRNSHAHLWWRGDAVDRPTLKHAARAGRFGTYLEVGTAFPAAESYKRPIIDYGLKEVLHHRAVSGVDLPPAAHDYLERNGGRLVHNTRGFWLDSEGRPCTLADATRAAHGTDASAWLFLGSE